MAVTHSPFQQNLYIHFNTPEHTLPLDEFLTSAIAIKKIAANLNRELFSNSAQYELNVIPPKEGTFLFGISLVAIGGATFKFLESDLGKGYVKGLTGHVPAYWAKEAGKLCANEASKSAAVITAKTAIVLKESIEGFLKKPKALLQKSKIPVEKFQPAHEAKNLFYEMCETNPLIEAIGFDKSESFPITRKKFKRQTTKIPNQEKESDWLVETARIAVQSPDWSPDGRKWLARFDGGKQIYFTVKDDAFWSSIHLENLQTRIGDILRVQWARKKHSGKQVAIVFKVLEFNGSKVSDPLNKEEIQKLLNKFTIVENNQLNLFDEA